MAEKISQQVTVEGLNSCFESAAELDFDLEIRQDFGAFKLQTRASESNSKWVGC